MKSRPIVLMATLLLANWKLASHCGAQGIDVAEIRPEIRTGFSHAGWKYDRYSELPSLDANSRMTVADLQGPGVIRHLHVTRHQNEQLASRGVVLEIYFDGANKPAVMCPLADFFGDGCNGESMNFSSKFIECAPWSYNCYFPMPFKKSAKVVLRNDASHDIMDYSFVEWENLPKWNDGLGYFHATYQRKSFQLTKDTDEVFFEVKGTGHILGRQFSVITDEPFFRSYNAVMEGNNEIDIDGRPRQIDYLGTEDSFTFSWGFRETFAAARVGMTLVEPGDVNRLSMYRFHDHVPIRFNKSLKWHINWQHEKYFTRNPAWQAAADRDGCWIDYATVHYWYQSEPGGYEHKPLRPLADRGKTMLHPVSDPPGMRAAFDRIKVDPKLENRFDTERDLNRVVVRNAYADTHPFWIDQPEPKGGHPGNPNPGKQGILAAHAKGADQACTILRKVALPADQNCSLRLVVSGDPYESPGRADFVLRAGIFDGQQIQWFDGQVVDAGTPPSADNWQTIEHALTDYAGKTVGIVVTVAYGGKVKVMNEEAFFDEISVVVEE
jgi:hypothetical protein